jgi:hypothetical protein
VPGFAQGSDGAHPSKVNSASTDPPAPTRDNGQHRDSKREKNQRRRFRDCRQLEINRRDLNRQIVGVRILAAATGSRKIKQQTSSPEATGRQIEKRPVNLTLVMLHTGVERDQSIERLVLARDKRRAQMLTMTSAVNFIPRLTITPLNWRNFKLFRAESNFNVQYPRSKAPGWPR